MTERLLIDPVNHIRREINGCKVQLCFLLDRNEQAECRVMNNLMGVFEQKVSNVQNSKLQLRQAQ